MLAERTGLPYALALTVTFLERLLDGLTILCLFVAASLITPTEYLDEKCRSNCWLNFCHGLALCLLSRDFPAGFI